MDDNLSGADIKAMVERLFVQEDDGSLDRLKLAGSRAVPFLVDALQDPRTETATFHKVSYVDQKSPFERICRLLGMQHGPPEAALALVKFLDNPNERFRAVAALELGNIATADCIGPVCKALADKSGGTGPFALIGVDRAIKENRGQRVFFDGIFPALTGLLNHLTHETKDAPKILVRIDKERAIQVLLSPELLSIENPHLQYILEGLNLVHHPIPHARLFPLMQQLEPTADRHPGSYQFGAALVSYAYNPDAETEPKLRSYLHSPSEIVGRSAAWALMALNGLENAIEDLNDTYEKKGFDGLSEPQKRYEAVQMYDVEVNNGGHSQYFGNSAGGEYRWAIDGLREIAAVEKLGILVEAVQVFGPDVPPADWEARREIVYSFSDEQLDLLDDLNARYYAGKENIDMLLYLYVVDNKDDFRNGPRTGL